jgi:hypothetical protein
MSKEVVIKVYLSMARVGVLYINREGIYGIILLKFM